MRRGATRSSHSIATAAFPPQILAARAEVRADLEADMAAGWTLDPHAADVDLSASRAWRRCSARRG